MVKLICGLLLSVGGIAFGLWAGVWWAFIGGIIQVVEQIRAPEMSAMALALGIAKIVFAGFIGWLSAMVLLLPGAALIKSA